MSRSLMRCGSRERPAAVNTDSISCGIAPASRLAANTAFAESASTVTADGRPGIEKLIVWGARRVLFADTSAGPFKTALAGNLCRCGTHIRILRAVKRASGQLA